MKKFVIMAVLAAAAMAASATEIGTRYSSGFAASGDKQGESTGVVVNQAAVVGGVGAELSFDRSATGPTTVDRYTALATYDVAKVFGATVTAKAGGAYVQPTSSTDGYALVAGVGVSYPIYKTVSLVADYSYQLGQDRIQHLDGNKVSVGVKFGF